MSKLEDIEKDIARLTADAKFSAWLDQLEGRLRAIESNPATGLGTPPGTLGRAATPADVISFRRDPRRFKRDGGGA